MSMLSRAVDRIVKDTASRVVADAISSGRIDQIINRIAFRPGAVLRRKFFETAMAGEFMRTDRSLTEKKAREIAAHTADLVVEDAGFYGNPAYAWDFDAAITAAHELEITHWESAP